MKRDILFNIFDTQPSALIRLEEILKDKGLTKKEVAKKIGWSEQKLYSRTKSGNPTLDTLMNLALGLDVEIHELFETSEKYAHWYDKGEWLGIQKKYK